MMIRTYVRIMHEMSRRLSTIAAMGRDAAMARFAEEDAEYAEQHARLAELAGWAPGPELAEALIAVADDTPDCWSQEQLTVLWGRMAAWVEAQSMRSYGNALANGDAESDRLVAVEVACDMHISEYSALSRAALVHQVADALPLSWEALNAGTLSLAHVRALAEVLRPCDPGMSTAVEAIVLPRAIARGWTPAQLRAAARRELLRRDPDGAAERAGTAALDADVRLCPEEHDMASIIATADAVTARAITDALEARAAELRRDGDDGPIGTLRVKALAGFVLGDQQAARPNVEVLLTMDLTTWLGLTHTPGELSGYGPITDSMARELARDAGLRRLLTDPLTGVMVDLGRQCYRPSRPLRRLIETRDRICRFPGCRRPASGCDLDHVVEWPAGSTSTDNLHALCRKHHNLKTSGAWDVTLHPDGSETWVSPFGATHHVPPAAYPMDGVTDTGPPEAAVSDSVSDQVDPTQDVEAFASGLNRSDLCPEPPADLTPAEIDEILDAQLDAYIDATLAAVRWPAYDAAYERATASSPAGSRAG